MEMVVLIRALTQINSSIEHVFWVIVFYAVVRIVVEVTKRN